MNSVVMTKQTVIDFSDLRFISISCPTCKTKLVLDALATGRDVPDACSACLSSYGSIKHQIGAFIRVYHAVKESEVSVRFQIDATSE